MYKIILLASLISFNVFAQSRDDLGGQVVICPKVIVPLMVAEANITMDFVAKNLDDALEVQLQRIGKYNPTRAKKLRLSLSTIEEDISRIPHVDLVNPEDWKTGIGRGCQIAKVLLQRTPIRPSDKKMIIDQTLWEKLNYETQAAILIEALYYREMLTRPKFSQERNDYSDVTTLSDLRKFLSNVLFQDEGISLYQTLISLSDLELVGEIDGLLLTVRRRYPYSNENYDKGDFAFGEKRELVLQGKKRKLMEPDSNDPLLPGYGHILFDEKMNLILAFENNEDFQLKNGTVITLSAGRQELWSNHAPMIVRLAKKAELKTKSGESYICIPSYVTPTVLTPDGYVTKCEVDVGTFVSHNIQLLISKNMELPIGNIAGHTLPGYLNVKEKTGQFSLDFFVYDIDFENRMEKLKFNYSNFRKGSEDVLSPLYGDYILSLNEKVSLNTISHNIKLKKGEDVYVFSDGSLAQLVLKNKNTLPSASLGNWATQGYCPFSSIKLDGVVKFARGRSLNGSFANIEEGVVSKSFTSNWSKKSGKEGKIRVPAYSRVHFDVSDGSIISFIKICN